MSPLVLYQFPGKDGLSLSPFVNKVHFALRLKKLEYTTKSLLFPRPTSETGRLPVLTHDGKKIHDSTEIIRYVEERFTDHPLIPKDKRRAAESHVLEEWSDESFMPMIQHARLYDRTAMKELTAISLPKIPDPFRGIAMSIRMRPTYKKFAYLHALGDDARLAQIDRSLDALETFLEDRRYLGGDEPSVADVAVGAAMHIMIFFRNTIEPWSRVSARPRLCVWLTDFFRATNVAVDGKL
jgi:glutathione S-transferase